MNLYTIHAGMFKLDGGAMFGVVPKSIWNKLNPADENNLCSWALRCLLIEENGKLILIDNGLGDKQDEKFFSHYHRHGEETLDGSLAKHGFNRDDITDVVLTHLHFDHCGGSIQREGDRLVPAFKKARYWSNENHWKWATQPNDREKASFLSENILPIQQSGQLHFVPNLSGAIIDETNGFMPTSSTISESLAFAIVNGHTDSMMLPVIEYKGHKIVYMADLLPSVAHLPIPYVMGYDMFPLKTLSEKKIFLQHAEANNLILYFEHDPLHECCTLEITPKGIRKKEVFKLSEL